MTRFSIILSFLGAYMCGGCATTVPETHVKHVYIPCPDCPECPKPKYEFPDEAVGCGAYCEGLELDADKTFDCIAFCLAYYITSVRGGYYTVPDQDAAFPHDWSSPMNTEPTWPKE